MPRRLFIGGYADGKWIDVRHDAPYHQIAEFPEIDVQALLRGPTAVSTQSTITTHTYKLEAVNFGSDHAELFYISTTLTPLGAFRKLLEGYHGTQSR